ncbi:MAG TPA: flagellar biosynthesis anti-sigma factor FlgM [Burkholderiales bacterium]|nr:flagellar biosynthesis anti-sigma factor FlgM [Burkholderiales bacterium]
MKIEHTSKSVVSLVASDKHRRTEKSGQAVAQSGAEKVDLSPLSSQLQAVDPGQTTDGVFDAARVQEIKQAISEGRFKVNADVVADRLLETVKELLQGRNTQ